MSMHNYPLSTIAFFVDHYVCAYANRSIDENNGTVPEEIAAIIAKGQFDDRAKAGTLPCGYSELDIAEEFIDGLCHCSEFAGNVDTLFDERVRTPIDLSFDDDYIAYIDIPREVSPCKAAYSSPEEMLADFRGSLDKQGIKLPEDFDWWAYIVRIHGTYFC